jgi:hypothetical protein
MRLIAPGVAPPDPRLTRTRQVPAYRSESDGLPSPFGSDETWIASTGLRVSETSALPEARPTDHWPARGPDPSW